MDAAVADLLAQLNAVFPRLGTEVVDAGEARAAFAALGRAAPGDVEGCSVSGRVIPGGDGQDLPLRVYRPEPAVAAGPTGVLVFCHGGGWVFGSLDSHHEIAGRLCVATGLVVVSVDYRLAPEHPYPAALDDTLAALSWVTANADALGADAGRVLVGGDSSGGNLAAAACLRLRDTGRPLPAGQLLLYAVLDRRRDTPSYADNAHGFYITRDHLAWFWEQYVGSRPAPYASPLEHADLAGLPPAVVVTAALDPLRDEGERYADRLFAAGVPTVARRYDAFHGFLAFADRLDVSAAAFDDIGAAVRDLLAARVSAS